MKNNAIPLCSLFKFGNCLNGREVWGRIDAHICMAKSLYCSPETITTLLIVYPPLQNKKPKINFKNIKYIQILKKKKGTKYILQ